MHRSQRAIITVVAIQTLLASAALAQTSATATGEAVFPGGASYAGIALNELDFGQGALLEADGTASGWLQATLFGTLATGARVELDIGGEIVEGAIDASGAVTLTGRASLSIDTEDLADVAFTVLQDATSVTLTLGPDTLPPATRTD